MGLTASSYIEIPTLLKGVRLLAAKNNEEKAKANRETKGEHEHKQGAQTREHKQGAQIKEHKQGAQTKADTTAAKREDKRKEQCITHVSNVAQNLDCDQEAQVQEHRLGTHTHTHTHTQVQQHRLGGKATLDAEGKREAAWIQMQDKKRQEKTSSSSFDELASIDRSCAAIVAGDSFSLMGWIDVNGFPNEEPAQKLQYKIPGDVLLCTLGTSVPRYLPYVEGTPPFAFWADPPLPDGLHVDAHNGQLHGVPVTSGGAQVEILPQSFLSSQFTWHMTVTDG